MLAPLNNSHLPGFAVVDVWDALISDRPYRSAWSKQKAFKYINEQSGKYFDPDIVKVFLKTIKPTLVNRKKTENKTKKVSYSTLICWFFSNG